MEYQEQVEQAAEGLVVCESLDRFSVPMPSELACYQFDLSNVYEVEKTVICESCNHEIVMEEGEYVESELWEDEYLHDDEECIQRYYDKNKRPERAEQV